MLSARCVELQSSSCGQASCKTRLHLAKLRIAGKNDKPTIHIYILCDAAVSLRHFDCVYSAKTTRSKAKVLGVHADEACKC